MAKTLNDVLSEIQARGNVDNPAVQTDPAAQPTAQPEATPAEPAQTDAQPIEPAQTDAQPIEPAQQAQPVQPAEPAAQPTQQVQNPQSAQLDALLTATDAYQKMKDENAQLKAQLQQSQAASQQQSQAAEQQITQIMQPPKLNRDNWEFINDAERDQRESDYATKMAEYANSSIMGVVKPLLDDFQNRSKTAAYDSARATLSTAPEFSGLIDDMDGINQILAKTPELQSLDPQKQLIMAALISKGAKSMNAPKQTPNPDAIAKQAMENPEVMRIIQTKQAEEISKKNQSLPPMSASSGMSSASALPQDKPTNFKDSLARAIKRFGG